MAGMAMTISYDDGTDRLAQRCNVKKISAAWTSDGTNGNVNAGNVTAKIVGRIIKVQTIPGAATPANNYNVTLTDSNGFDLSANCDANITNQSNATNTETYLLVKNHLPANAIAGVAVHPAICDTLTIAVANAGNSKTGTIVIHYAPV